MSTHSNLRIVKEIVSQAHETPDDAIVSSLQQSVQREKNEVLRTNLNDIKNSLTCSLKTQRAVELASEKGASNWLTVIPIDEMGFEQGRVPRRSKAQI